MLRNLRSKLTYANVMVSLLALIALGGGTAYAAGQLGRNTVGPRQLKRGAVNSAKVRNHSLRAIDFAPGQLPRGSRGPAGKRGPDGKRGATGPRGPAGPTGSQGPSHAFQANGASASVGAAAFGTTPVSLPLPAGSYSVTATVEADTGDGKPGSISCRLTNGSASTTRSQGLSANAVASFPLAAGFKVGGGQNLSLQCNRGGESEQVRVLAANVVAVEVGDLSGATG